ncbi:unnamed protein product [Periconia digitata]|uniref:Uncharacterized protein n=1 Tax=Periconia digitata TaxID=1303443 RepID=A0A9W4U8P8_9PLEO|nr:unnamed protein product [Periconia digitata]
MEVPVDHCPHQVSSVTDYASQLYLCLRWNSERFPPCLSEIHSKMFVLGPATQCWLRDMFRL